MTGRAWDADAGLEELYDQHWHRLVRLSYLLLHDQGSAEEVVQDAFVAMHGRWNTLRDPDHALAYLRQSVVNRSRSVLRHRSVVTKHLRRGLGERLLDAPPASVPVEADERRDRVLAALRQLPRRQREVLALRHYLELSEREIAATLGISAGAVKSHASRGAAALRALLGTEEDR